MKTILIVGKSFSGLKKAILRNGYDYLILQDKAVAKFPEKKYKKVVMADFSTTSTLIESVTSMDKKIDAVMTIYESYVLPAAHIAHSLKLPGIPVEAAVACTDKMLMRKLFTATPKKISPGFAEVTDKESLITFSKNHLFPLILKPANLSKSLLVTKSNNISELLNNYDKTLASIDAIYAKYAPNRIPKLLVEEFMEGPIHSVDAFVDANGKPHVLEQVVDYQTGYDIGYNDNFHYSRILPSKLSSTEQNNIRETAALGCRALGMRSSPAHIEIILTINGPMIVEIGARNGGYRERMHLLANGIDISNNAIALALNKPLDLTATKDDSCAVLELFPKTNGLLKSIANIEDVKKLSSFVYFAQKKETGSYVGKSSDGHKMCGIIILHNQDATAFYQDLDFIKENVFVVTD